MALLEVRLGCVRGPTLLCSRSGSAGDSGSSQLRDWVTLTRFGSAPLGSARLGSVCYVVLGSFGVLTQALRLCPWAGESAQYSARLSSGSTRGLLRGSRLGVRLGLARGSAGLTWIGTQVGSSRLGLTRFTNYYSENYAQAVQIKCRQQCKDEKVRDENRQKSKRGDEKPRPTKM